MTHEAVTELDLTPPVKTETKGEAKPKKEKKSAVAKSEAPTEPKAASNRSKLAATYPLDAKLTVITDGNPKKPGSRAFDIFEFYKSSATVGDFFRATAEYISKAGKKQPGTYGDITYDVGHGFIKVG